MLIESLSSSVSRANDRTTARSDVSAISLHKHLLAMILDSMVLILARLFLGVCGALVLQSYQTDVMQKFLQTFGQVEPNLANADHFALLIHSKFGVCIALMIILFIALGILYYGFMTASSWRATFGQRIVGFYVTDMLGQDISNKRAWMRVYCSYIPWTLLLLIPYLWYRENRFVSVALLIALSFWHDMTIFCRKRFSMHDVITSTRFVYGRRGVYYDDK